jgi:hypothetical protein
MIHEWQAEHEVLEKIKQKKILKASFCLIPSNPHIKLCMTILVIWSEKMFQWKSGHEILEETKQ